MTGKRTVRRALVYCLAAAVAISSARAVLGWLIWTHVQDRIRAEYGLDLRAQRPVLNFWRLGARDVSGRLLLDGGSVEVAARRLSCSLSAGDLWRGRLRAGRIVLTDVVADGVFGKRPLPVLDPRIVHGAALGRLTAVSSPGGYDVGLDGIDVRLRKADGPVVAWLRNVSGRLGGSMDGKKAGGELSADSIWSRYGRLDGASATFDVADLVVRSARVEAVIGGSTVVAAGAGDLRRASSLHIDVRAEDANLFDLLALATISGGSTPAEADGAAPDGGTAWPAGLAATLAFDDNGRPRGTGELTLPGGAIPAAGLLARLFETIGAGAYDDTYSPATVPLTIAGDRVQLGRTLVKTSAAEVCLGGTLAVGGLRGVEVWALVRLDPSAGPALRLSPALVDLLRDEARRPVLPLRVTAGSADIVLLPAAIEAAEGKVPAAVRKQLYFGQRELCWPATPTSSARPGS